MIKTSIRLSRDLKGGQSVLSLLSRQQMGTLARFARDTAVLRIRNGRDVNDAPMPALQQAYARAKARQGLQPLRDMWGTGRQGGHMLDAFQVISVTESDVTIGFQSAIQRLKAFKNAQRVEFVGLSPADLGKVMEKAHNLIRSGISPVDFIRALARRAA